MSTPFSIVNWLKKGGDVNGSWHFHLGCTGAERDEKLVFLKKLYSEKKLTGFRGEKSLLKPSSNSLTIGWDIWLWIILLPLDCRWTFKYTFKGNTNRTGQLFLARISLAQMCISVVTSVWRWAESSGCFSLNRVHVDDCIDFGVIEMSSAQ